MNEINLKGIIKNIQYSHNIGDVEYDRADLIVKRNDGKEDIITLKFKRFCNRYNENDTVELKGNIRSFSRQIEDNKNKVDIHVFTYFDLPDGEEEIINEFELDGNICKKDILRVTKSGKEHCHFILANNIINNGYKINSYLPVVSFGKDAIKVNEMEIGTHIHIKGQLHSREYVKRLPDGEIEFRVAHELIVTDIIEDEVE